MPALSSRPGLTSSGTAGEEGLVAQCCTQLELSSPSQQAVNASLHYPLGTRKAFRMHFLVSLAGRLHGLRDARQLRETSLCEFTRILGSGRNWLARTEKSHRIRRDRTSCDHRASCYKDGSSPALELDPAVAPGNCAEQVLLPEWLHVTNLHTREIIPLIGPVRQTLRCLAFIVTALPTADLTPKRGTVPVPCLCEGVLRKGHLCQEGSLVEAGPRTHERQAPNEEQHLSCRPFFRRRTTNRSKHINGQRRPAAGMIMT